MMLIFKKMKLMKIMRAMMPIGVGENLLVDRRTAAPTMQSPSNAALVMQPRAAPSSQCSPTNLFPAVQPNVDSQVQSRQCSLTNAAPTM